MSSEFQDGFELDKGIIIGPGVFANKGLTSIQPPIWVFKFGMGTLLNKLKKEEMEHLDKTEFQQHFNSTLDDLVSEILIYLEERLKVSVAKNKLECRKRNSVPGMVKCYKNYLQINLDDIQDLSLLKAVDVKRGKRHHTIERYFPNFKISDTQYDSITKLIELCKDVQSAVEILDKKLDEIHPIYNVKITKNTKDAMVEWTCIKHAFDLVNEKIIEKRAGVRGVDKSHVTYFAIVINYK